MPLPRVLSLCDRSGVMVQPWLEAGFPCTIVDLQHEPGTHDESVLAPGGGTLTTVGADVTKWLPPLDDYAIVFAFPPCTHLAISGARWMKTKGLPALIEGLTVVNACKNICEWAGVPWMLENPVSTLSTYWRKPDCTFDPCDYAGYPGGGDDLYTKKTCLWTGNGFVMPPPRFRQPEGRNPIHWAAPGPDRADLRSVTPAGFARAVFEANLRPVLEKTDLGAAYADEACPFCGNRKLTDGELAWCANFHCLYGNDTDIPAFQEPEEPNPYHGTWSEE